MNYKRDGSRSLRRAAPADRCGGTIAGQTGNRLVDLSSIGSRRNGIAKMRHSCLYRGQGCLAIGCCRCASFVRARWLHAGCYLKEVQTRFGIRRSTTVIVDLRENTEDSGGEVVLQRDTGARRKKDRRVVCRQTTMTDYLDPHFVRALCRDPERRTLQVS
ncbi:hypothetical protein K0M31_007823 [Melipona bicolor]|uniref:Uncharacterized protein n=1 Tax=Melipona bicolor TaxID=60889 RepID=A0AA40GDI7_9HYME|nr:hypothetical protein K0M31_007823 [Melipona bicolor]